MPFASKTGLRSFTQKVVTSTPSIPDYAVLFAVGDAFRNSTLLKNVFNFGFTSDYYRTLDYLTGEKIERTSGPSGYTRRSAKRYFLYCVDDENDWSITLGKTELSNTNLDAPSYATYLDFAGGHNVTAVGSRSTVPLTLATIAGKTLTTGNAVVYSTDGSNVIISNVYVTQTASHPGHLHYVPGNTIYSGLMQQQDFGVISANVMSSQFSSYIPQIWPPYEGYFRLQTTDQDRTKPNYFNTGGGRSTPQTYGYSNIKVKPIIRDPNLKGGNTPQTKLPGGILVFGADLPSQYYLRPYYTSNGSTTNIQTGTNYKISVGSVSKFPANFYHEADWYETGDTVLVSTASQYDSYDKFKPFKGVTTTVTVNSSEVPDHSHSNIPIKYLQKSTDIPSTSPSVFSLNTAYQKPAGAHFHQVDYTVNYAIKSKRLKAWVTKDDNTPLANGVIIAYCKSDWAQFAGDSSPANLPPYWHFCDGTNDTPDLRGYCIAANFKTSAHDEVVEPAGGITLEDITVLKSGSHTHSVSAGSVRTPTGTHIGTPADIGGHDYETTSDHAHTHQVPNSSNTVNIFRVQINPVPQPATAFSSVKIGSSWDFTPPTFKLAFIMYNENVP